MAASRTRVGGGYTTFAYAGKVLLYVEILQDTAPRPVAPPTPIHPLGEPHPIEIAFPKAMGIGTLVLTISEQWASDIWNQLPGFEGAESLLDVFIANVQRGSVQCTKTITLPDGGKRVVNYMGCVVTDLDESETVTVGTMNLPKRITISYLHKKRARI